MFDERIISERQVFICVLDILYTWPSKGHKSYILQYCITVYGWFWIENKMEMYKIIFVLIKHVPVDQNPGKYRENSMYFTEFGVLIPSFQGTFMCHIEIYHWWTIVKLSQLGMLSLLTTNLKMSIYFPTKYIEKMEQIWEIFPIKLRGFIWSKLFIKHIFGKHL